MGCGCKERSAMLKGAARHLAKGDVKGAVRRAEVVSASTAKTTQQIVARAKLRATRMVSR